MVDYRFPLDAQMLWAGLRGHSIVMVRRQVLLSDYEDLPPEIRDEESDGPTELVFDDGTTIHFVPDTEQMSIKIGEGKMPGWGDYYKQLELTANQFWAHRVRRPVAALDVLVSSYAGPDNRSEFGLELRLEGGVRLLIEYLSDDAHTDTLRISGEEPAGSYRRVNMV